MKKGIYLLILLTASVTISAQSEEQETGFPGDHFSLEGTLELFKQSDNLEEFEKKLNQQDSDVNNLDLNEDGETDYIRVEDHMDGDVHAIILQVPVNENESQDIAVIEIEKTGSSSAVLQIVGNEDIFGEETYVEPFEEVASSTGSGPDADYELVNIVVNVWGWSSVRYVYRPAYRVYVSPWRYRYYPVWYRPWRPRPFRTFVAAVSPFRVNYRVVNTHRVVRAHKIYTPRKKTSVTVKKKTTITRSNRTISKTTTAGVVKGANGGKAVGKKTTVTATNGNKTVSKTTSAAAGKNAEGGKAVGKKTAVTATNGNKTVSKTKAAGVKKTNKATTKKKSTSKTKKTKNKKVKKTRTKTKKKKN